MKSSVSIYSGSNQFCALRRWICKYELLFVYKIHRSIQRQHSAKTTLCASVKRKKKEKSRYETEPTMFDYQCTRIATSHLSPPVPCSCCVHRQFYDLVAFTANSMFLLCSSQFYVPVVFTASSMFLLCSAPISYSCSCSYFRQFHILVPCSCCVHR